MSLREKLRLLSQGVEGLSGEELVEDWLQAVKALFTEVRSFLVEYQAENLLGISEDEIFTTEERLGAYTIPRLKLRAGLSSAVLTPYARVVAGALGRVDFTRADSSDYGYMLLRQGPSVSDWQISHRRRNPFISGGGPLDEGPITYSEPLSKDSFEHALEQLLG